MTHRTDMNRIMCVLLGDHDELARMVKDCRSVLSSADRAAWDVIAAMRALLLPSEARPADLTLTIARHMIRASNHGSAAEQLAHAIAAWMPYAPDAPPEAYAAVVRMLQHNPYAAAHAMIAASAWTDQHGEDAGPHAASCANDGLRRACMDAIDAGIWNVNVMFARLAPHWMRLHSDLRERLLHAAVKRSSAAFQALNALMPIEGALTHEFMRMLVAAIVRDGAASSMEFKAFASHWHRLPADVRDALLEAAMQRPDASAWILCANGPHHGALTHARVHASGRNRRPKRRRER